ncbi:MAG: hypothetical protein CMO80_22645 [Verrucomicrobiales bacterium]|nr:hypothetical protein [Verrucomicrobiales bacterium]|tara:strand:- start:2170 stop:2775 length:606 start_codon:yes stop_codon:yes gene_type:complete
MKTFHICLLAAFLTGCMSLDPKPDPTRHFTLSARATSANESTGVSIYIGEVEIPEYLNRSNLVLRKSGNEITISEYDRWAEPLENGITRVIAENISAHTGSRKVFTSAAGSSSSFLRVRVQVHALEPADSGIIASASWKLMNQSDQVLDSGQWKTSGDVQLSSDSDTAAKVSAMSELLAQLSNQISDAILKATSSPQAADE